MPAPDWGRLFEIAATQEGHFTTAQAAEAGYYPQLLNKHLRSERIVRVRRGIYRLVQFPIGEHEDLVVVWLWTALTGVFSHETALALHGLSDALPAKAYITLPDSWKKRRLRVPAGVVPHFADIGDAERAWSGAVPVTTADRTLVDCARVHVSPDFVCDAFEDAADRGLIDRNSLPSVVSYLKQFFSVSRSRSGPRFRSNSERSRRGKK